MKKCTAILDNGRLSIGNGLIDRVYDGVVSVKTQECDNGGLSLPFLSILVDFSDGESCELRIWDDLSAIEEASHRTADTVSLSGDHWIVRAVKLSAVTDNHDSFVCVRKVNMFEGKIPALEGHIFFAEDPQSGDALVIIAEVPDFRVATLRISGRVLSLETFGNGAVTAHCKMGECEATARDIYRHIWKPLPLFSMSNTWGDRNGWSRVNEEFVKREVDAAEELMVDIVQIDDGWQKGCTGDPAIFDENRWRMFHGDFWELNTERFPSGIASITEYAHQKGVQTGLWFAPHSKDNFALIERDKQILRKAYDEWGIRFFKLDMLFVVSDESKRKMFELLEAIYSLGDDVKVQLDITNGTRLGYLCGARYGSLFMENRYTASANSFPHRILRNLWLLSKYLPTAKFQFEMVNPTLFADAYLQGDPFVPSLYEQDYMFAAVMLSNPLYWMEMQFLPKERRDELMRLVPVWRKHRGALGGADVRPIGEEPSGRSLTGFVAVCNGGKGKDAYLLLFREVTDRDECVLDLGNLNVASTELLAANGAVRLDVQANRLCVKFGKQRMYAFFKVSVI